MLSVKSTTRRTILPTLGTLAALCVAALTPLAGYAEQPPPPCHPNPQAAADMATVASRGDVALLPTPLKDRLVQLAGRPHTFLPMQVNAEAPGPSQFFQYYLLDTQGFERNVFTARIPGVNDQAMLTVTGANCGLPTVGASNRQHRLVVHARYSRGEDVPLEALCIEEVVLEELAGAWRFGVDLHGQKGMWPTGQLNQPVFQRGGEQRDVSAAGDGGHVRRRLGIRMARGRRLLRITRQRREGCDTERRQCPRRQQDRSSRGRLH